MRFSAGLINIRMILWKFVSYAIQLVQHALLTLSALVAVL